MSNRYNGLTVVLEADATEEWKDRLVHAIGTMKGVLSVTGHVADFESHIAEERARAELSRKLLKVVFPKVGE
jgi:hypothetical protein